MVIYLEGLTTRTPFLDRAGHLLGNATQQPLENQTDLPKNAYAAIGLGPLLSVRSSAHPRAHSKITIDPGARTAENALAFRMPHFGPTARRLEK
jgi:hypothetical protein